MTTNTGTDNMVYLKDFVLSIPIPPCFQIKEDEITTYLAKLSEIHQSTNNAGETYVTFGKFFGESSPLNRVSFNVTILEKVTNDYLSQLESYIKAEIKKDKLYPRCIFVEDVHLPLEDHSWSPVKVIFK